MGLFTINNQEVQTTPNYKPGILNLYLEHKTLSPTLKNYTIDIYKSYINTDNETNQTIDINENSSVSGVSFLTPVGLVENFTPSALKLNANPVFDGNGVGTVQSLKLVDHLDNNIVFPETINLAQNNTVVGFKIDILNLNVGYNNTSKITLDITTVDSGGNVSLLKTLIINITHVIA